MCVCVCLCVFVCVCVCGFTVSVRGFQGFGLVMFGAPGTALPGTALPGTALPGTALPGTALPGTALPGTALPGTAQNFALFFPSPAAKFVLFFLSGCLLVEFWWCLKCRDPQMCTFGLSDCRVKPRRPHQTGPPGLAHDSPRTPNVHI